MSKILSKSIFSLITGTLLLWAPLSAQSGSNDPNGANSQPQPGWSLWRPKSEMEKADFSAGFSNMELGAGLDFENACATNAGIPSEQVQYWFRLSNTVERIGTGLVETGCWVNGKFLHTYTITAIKSSLENVDCLRVIAPKGLIIREDSSQSAKRVGRVRQGAKVGLESFPALMRESEGQNWVLINSPKEGWISDGTSAGSGNLRLCTPPRQKK